MGEIDSKLKLTLEELLNRSVPYDTIYMRTWIINAKEAIEQVLDMLTLNSSEESK